MAEAKTTFLFNQQNTFAIYSINYRIRKVELELARNFLRLDYGRNCKNPPTKLKNVPYLFGIKL